MKEKIVAILWAALFIFGIFLILNNMQITRYASDLNGVTTAGIIISSFSGIGFLLELYGKRK